MSFPTPIIWPLLVKMFLIFYMYRNKWEFYVSLPVTDISIPEKKHKTVKRFVQVYRLQNNINFTETLYLIYLSPDVNLGKAWIIIFQSRCHYFIAPWITFEGSPHGVMAYMLDFDIDVSSNSSHASTFTFGLIFLWKVWISSLILLAKGQIALFFYKDEFSIK